MNRILPSIPTSDWGCPMAVATNWWSEIWSKGRSPKDKTSHKVTANDQMEAERDQVKPRSEDREDKDEAADCFR